MIVTIAVGVMLLMGLGVGVSLIGEGVTDLRRGMPGHENIIVGVGISILMLICAVALAVATIGG